MLWMTYLRNGVSASCSGMMSAPFCILMLPLIQHFDSRTLLISLVSLSHEVLSLLVLIPFLSYIYCSNSCRCWYILYIYCLLFYRLVENVGYSPFLFLLITFLREGIRVFSFSWLYPPSTNPISLIVWPI